MADTYADVTDVTDRWAWDPTDAEVTLISTRLADVERMIRRRIPDLDDLVGADTILEEDVRQVEADAVLRLVRNPEGYLSETDGDYTYQLRQDLATGRLSILPEEWEILGVHGAGMFVIAATPVMPS